VRLPRDISGAELAQTLISFGYSVTRQTGSHLRQTTANMGEHHVTVPAHKVLPLGTLRAVLRQVGAHFQMTVDEVAMRLFASR
jgi:predicted RNA binding protein YcfA (HicA-like mRNA interferase family)